MNKEFIRASTMLRVSENRVAKTFNNIAKICVYRKQEETIGFEGTEWFKCCNPKHPHVKSIYPSCSSRLCVYAKEPLEVV